MENKDFLRVMGSNWWLPEPGDDCSCYLLNDDLLIDTGWYSVHNMIEMGIDPTKITTVCLTHTHCDHYIGLAHFLMYWRIKKATLKGLTIVGPKETVRAGFEITLNFILHDSRDLHEEIAEMPEIIEMKTGDVFNTGKYTIEAMHTEHAVPGVAYRITDVATHAVLGVTGDTQYKSEYGPFFHDCNILIHESTFGKGPTDPEENKYCKHSSAYEAAIVAEEAGAKQLLLVHTCSERHQESVERAQSMLDIPVEWAQPFKIYNF